MAPLCEITDESSKQRLHAFFSHVIFKSFILGAARKEQFSVINDIIAVLPGYLKHF
jgi:hypothetical protein